MFCRELEGTALGIFLWGNKETALAGGLGANLGATMDANSGQKKILLKRFFWDSNPGQIIDYNEMRLFSLSIYIRKISNLTT